jgi:hypothetical protein
MLQFGEINFSLFDVTNAQDWNTNAIAVSFFARSILNNSEKRTEPPSASSRWVSGRVE